MEQLTLVNNLFHFIKTKFISFRAEKSTSLSNDADMKRKQYSSERERYIELQSYAQPTETTATFYWNDWWDQPEIPQHTIFMLQRLVCNYFSIRIKYTPKVYSIIYKKFQLYTINSPYKSKYKYNQYDEYDNELMDENELVSKSVIPILNV